MVAQLNIPGSSAITVFFAGERGHIHFFDLLDV
jgi:hypothetical protein